MENFKFTFQVFLHQKGLSNYLNKRDTYLDSDFTESNVPATQYDTDLENFWTQTSINEILITVNHC